MTSTIPALEIRRRLGRDDWMAPVPFGPDGWVFESKRELVRIILTCGPAPEGLQWWWHASIARENRMPDYDDLTMLHHAVWGAAGWAYQCFAPATSHVNIHEHALHLWGMPDGSPALPNFGANGSI